MTPYAITADNPTGRKLKLLNGMANKTAKKCIPLFDGICAGYVVPLWCDVLVEVKKDMPVISWRIPQDVFQLHGESAHTLPPPLGFNNHVFKFLTYFRIETPRGYSINVQPPAGHYQLPFRVIPAVIDSDRSVIDNNFPCWVQDGFEGIVEKGTPIAQVVPFKRTDWKAEMSLTTPEEHHRYSAIGFQSNIINNYVRNIWSKKGYD
jgi:hypothetical protein